MASGVIKGVFVDNDNNLRPEIHWSYSQNVTKNQTTITCTLKIYKKTSYGVTYKSNTACKMTMNGETLYSATKSLNCSNVSTGSYLTVGSFTKTITHNSSGQFVYSGTTGKMSLYGSIDFSGNNTGWGYVPSKGDTTSITIPSIPVNSSIDSVTNDVTMNGSNKITTKVTLGLSNYSCKITYSIGDYSYTMTDSSTSSKSRTVSYAPPKSWCNAIPNATSSKLTVTCKTYSGSTLIDTTSKTVTVNVPTDIVPTISSWSISAGNSYSTINNIKYWLKDLSTAKVTATGSGSYSSKISKINITFPSGTYSISNGGSVTKLLTKSGTVTITAKVYDTRGRSKTYSKSIAVRDYKYPYIDNFKITKVSKDSDGTYYEDDTSNTLKISFKVGAHKIAKTTVSCAVTYTTGTTSGTAISTTDFTVGSTVTKYVTISSLDSSATYNFSCKVTDEVGKTSISTFTLKPEALIFDFNKSGKSIGIGIKSNFKDNTVGVEMCKDLFLGGNMQTDEEKNIYFFNSNSSATIYKHKCKIYGGNGDSRIAIGIWDFINDIPVMRYYDTDKKIIFPSTTMDVGGEITILTNAKAFKGVDTSGNTISLAHIGADNISKFGYGSYYAHSASAYDNGSEYLGGASASLRSMDKVYLCCNNASPSSKSPGKIEYYLDSVGNYVFRPTASGVYNGTASYMWDVVYAVNGIKTSSDRTKKENIKYFDYNSNPNTIKETDIHLNDLLNFITNDYELTTYNYIGSNKERLSGIAQDIICNKDGKNNEVGQLIVDCEEAVENEAGLCIDQSQLLNVTIGAFQQFVKDANSKTQALESKITEQDARIKKLEDLVNNLVNVGI